MWCPGWYWEIYMRMDDSTWCPPSWELGPPRRALSLCCCARISTRTAVRKSNGKEAYLGFRGFNAVGEISILYRFRSVTGWCHLHFCAGAVWELDFFCDIIRYIQRKQMESSRGKIHIEKNTLSWAKGEGSGL